MGVTALILHLILSHAFAGAAEVARPQSSPRPPAGYQRDCENRYSLSRCDDFFRENPELLPYKIDCRQPIDAGAELKKLAEGAVGGAKDMWNLILDIGTNIWNGPQNTPERRARVAYLNECAKVQECKMNLIRSVRSEEIPPSFERRLAQVSSGSVLETLVFANQQHTSGLRKEEVRRLLRTMPDGPERDAKISEVLPGWSRQRDQSHRSLWELGLAGADRLGKFGNCYNREVQMEAVGYGLATLLIPGAAIKVGSKLGQISSLLARGAAATAARTAALRVTWAERVTEQSIRGNAKLEKAVADAHAVGAGQIGRDRISPTRFGNYTDAQLKEKMRILEAGGFSPEAAKNLVRRGVVGHDEATMALIARAETEFDRIETVAMYYANDSAKTAEIAALQARLLEECIAKGVTCKEILEKVKSIQEPFRTAPALSSQKPASLEGDLFARNPAIDTQITKKFGTSTQEQIREKIASLEENARLASANRGQGQNIDFNVGKPLTHTPGMREIRLFEHGGPRIYFAFDSRTGRLDILGVGNKASQWDDIHDAYSYFKALQAARK